MASKALIEAAKIFLDVLSGVWLGATSQARRKVLVEEAQAVVEQAGKELAGRSLIEVQERFELFAQEAGL